MGRRKRMNSKPGKESSSNKSQWKQQQQIVVVGIFGLLTAGFCHWIFRPAAVPLVSRSTTTNDNDCRIYLAPSTIPDAGWGLFTSRSIHRNEQILFDDPIIHHVDLKTHQEGGITRLLHDYMWHGSAAMGHNEGKVVYSAWLGTSMLANSNVRNIVPQVGTTPPLRRETSPGAGSITTTQTRYFAVEDMDAGQEIFVNYGQDSFPRVTTSTKRTVGQLEREGYCVDRLYSGTSKVSDVGRAAFARVDFDIGASIMTSPMVPVLRSSVEKQLLLNYCFGHEESPILLVPAAPGVGLLNHADEPNAKIVWSSASVSPEHMTLTQVAEQPTGLVLEVVAVKRIGRGEEVTIDYGSSWKRAWEEHTASWQPATALYTYAAEFNLDINSLPIRTESQQQIQPYPDNLQTSCFVPNEIGENDTVQSFRPLTMPCRVLDLVDDDLYIVEMNDSTFRIPRRAITMTDRPYTSDQHLETAFRHAIGFEAFPEHWMGVL